MHAAGMLNKKLPPYSFLAVKIFNYYQQAKKQLPPLPAPTKINIAEKWHQNYLAWGGQLFIPFLHTIWKRYFSQAFLYPKLQPALFYRIAGRQQREA